MTDAAIVIAVRFGFYLACAAVAAVLIGCGGGPDIAPLVDPVCINADDTLCKD